MKNFKAKLLGVCVFVIALATSCNHGFDKVVPGSPALLTNVSYRTPKILYIIADGARGSSVRDGVIPTINSLLPNSIYSWNSLSSASSTTDATAWADMITGVSVAKHNVTTEDFAGNKLTDYPSIFSRIKTLRPKLRIAAFAASSAFKTNLTGGTDVSELLGSDDAVKTRMIDFLKTDTASLVVGEFAAIETAGKSSAFDNSSPTYKAAITNFDTQVGQLLAAVKARPNYANENWMIVITSNKGGQFTLTSGNDNTVFSNTNINTFTLFYNAGYKNTFIAKPFVGNPYTGVAPRFIGSPTNATARVINPYYATQRDAVNSKGDVITAPFNFGSSRSFTISVKLKKHKNPSNISRGDYYYQWPGILGKKGTSGYVAGTYNPATGVTTPPTPATPVTSWGDASGQPLTPGWEFCILQNRWRFFIAGNDTSPGVATGFTHGDEIMGAEILDENWHDLTAVCETKADGKRYIRLYTDGVPGITNKSPGTTAVPSTAEFGPLPGTPNFDNNSAVRLGYTPGEIDSDYGKIDVELKEFKIFSVALPDLVAKQYACDQTIDRSHPYYDYLAGYWPCNDATVNATTGVVSQPTVIADKGPYGADMQLSNVTWSTFDQLMCSPPATDYTLTVPKNTDIPVQILSWFNISRLTSWGLDGKVWIAN